jgi:hypothetical protein
MTQISTRRSSEKSQVFDLTNNGFEFEELLPRVSPVMVNPDNE